MAVSNLSLTHKGGRKQTRGWVGSKHYKKQTSRANRRYVLRQLKEGQEDIVSASKKGWVW